MKIIDFDDAENAKRVNEILARHPEMLGAWKTIVINGVERKVIIPSFTIEIVGESQIYRYPGTPKQTAKKIDWDAWFLYHQMRALEDGKEMEHEELSRIMGMAIRGIPLDPKKPIDVIAIQTIRQHFSEIKASYKMIDI